jgi:hypothetical protein
MGEHSPFVRLSDFIRSGVALWIRASQRIYFCRVKNHVTAELTRPEMTGTQILNTAAMFFAASCVPYEAQNVSSVCSNKASAIKQANRSVILATEWVESLVSFRCENWFAGYALGLRLDDGAARAGRRCEWLGGPAWVRSVWGQLLLYLRLCIGKPILCGCASAGSTSQFTRQCTTVGRHAIPPAENDQTAAPAG